MKILALKESQAPYNVALNETLFADEVVILEKNGQPVAALVPMPEYTAFQAWRKKEESRQIIAVEETAIDHEHAAFQRMLPDLLKQYPGQAVAIFNGEVVGVGDSKMKLWAQMRQELGPVPVYVQVVEATQRVYKMPHCKVVG